MRVSTNASHQPERDCWLGINGVPSAYGGLNHQNAIAHYVQTIEASNGMYPVPASCTGTPQERLPGDHQSPMPDADHAPPSGHRLGEHLRAIRGGLRPAGGAISSRQQRHDRQSGNAGATGVQPVKEGYATVGNANSGQHDSRTGAANAIRAQVIHGNVLRLTLTYKPADSLNNLMAVVDIAQT